MYERIFSGKEVLEISKGLVGWLFDMFYGVSTLFGSFNAQLNFKQFSLVYSFYLQTVKSQNSSISNNSIYYKYTV